MLENVFILHNVATGLRQIIIADSLEEAKSNYTLALENPDIKMYQAHKDDIHKKYLD